MLLTRFPLRYKHVAELKLLMEQMKLIEMESNEIDKEISQEQ